jgi:lon-related putative ATP-dependent protease
MTEQFDDLSQVQLEAAGTPVELRPEDTDVQIDMAALDFSTTETVQPLAGIIGQERAMEALDIGIGISQDGYNVFVSGMAGAGKISTISRSIEEKLGGSPVPVDWVYVNNFDRTDEPVAISFPPGKARQFRRDMKVLVERLIQNLSKAFRQEDFSNEKQRLGEKYNKLFQEQMEGLAGRAKERGFELSPGPQGNIFFIPIINGKVPESSEELKSLSDEEKNRIQQGQDQLSGEAAKLMQNQHDMLHNLTEEVRQVERRFGESVIQPIIESLKNAYKENPKVTKYLDGVTRNVLDNLADFREGGKKQVPAGPFGMPQEVTPSFLEYQVNIVVDNSETKRAPVITEEAPTYRNLFGTIERSVDPMGRLTTNFMQIKAGALLHASGGYLVFNLMDALTEPFVYKSLKRTLKSGQLEIETYDAWLPFSTGGIRPEPIPIRTKVVVIGDEYLYYMLRFYDEEFSAVFKVRADFGSQMPFGPEQQKQYAEFIAKKVKDENLKQFNRYAVAEIIRCGARKAAQKDKLFTRFSEIADLLRESDYFARKSNAEFVGPEHVRAAMKSKVYRSDRIAEKIRELIADGIILISTKDKAVGQINGLAVLDFGDFMFGRPSRVTASIGLGAEGVVNIEREARLSGSTHDKGVLILAGYIRNLYGRDKPLALSASICFEQSYGGIDGDSASSTELFVLLTRLADVPVRQDIAVTGSVNQWGQIQAIGAVNEKIEGFFDVCSQAGLTGRQGVCIPASNVRNLVLRDDVRQAIAEGRFHIYPIATVDQGLELITGLKAGSTDQEGTLHWLIDQKLRRLAQELRDFGKGAEVARIASAAQQAPPNVPPRLPDEQP